MTARTAAAAGLELVGRAEREQVVEDDPVDAARHVLVDHGGRAGRDRRRPCRRRRRRRPAARAAARPSARRATSASACTTTGRCTPTEPGDPGVTRGLGELVGGRRRRDPSPAELGRDLGRAAVDGELDRRRPERGGDRTERAGVAGERDHRPVGREVGERRERAGGPAGVVAGRPAEDPDACVAGHEQRGGRGHDRVGDVGGIGHERQERPGVRGPVVARDRRGRSGRRTRRRGRRRPRRRARCRSRCPTRATASPTCRSPP